MRSPQQARAGVPGSRSARTGVAAARACGVRRQSRHNRRRCALTPARWVAGVSPRGHCLSRPHCFAGQHSMLTPAQCHHTFCRSILSERHHAGSCSHGACAMVPRRCTAHGLSCTGAAARDRRNFVPSVRGLRRLSETARYRVRDDRTATRYVPLDSGLTDCRARRSEAAASHGAVPTLPLPAALRPALRERVSGSAYKRTSGRRFDAIAAQP